MSMVRLRRLTADYEKLQAYAARHPRVRLVQANGDPPDRYQIEYRLKSLRMVNDELQEVTDHLVEVTLPLRYPRLPPQCRMLTPVFHPNIAPHAICVGDHWGAGESLESIVIRIGEMLAYQSYNVKSPLNGEAARWIEENKARAPLDPTSLLPEEEPNVPPAPATGVPPTATATAANGTAAVRPPPVSAVDSSAKLRIACPACGKQYLVPPEYVGRTVACKSCQQKFRCAPANDAAPESAELRKSPGEGN